MVIVCLQPSHSQATVKLSIQLAENICLKHFKEQQQNKQTRQKKTHNNNKNKQQQQPILLIAVIDSI